MGQTVIDESHEAIIETVKPGKTKKSVKAIDDNGDNNVSNSDDAATSMEADQCLADELPRNHSLLILDAIVAEQVIRYPTDLGLLHAQRSFIDNIEYDLSASNIVDYKGANLSPPSH